MCVGVGRGWEATSITSGTGVFTLTLLLSTLTMCGGDINNVTHPVSVPTVSVWGECKQCCLPCSVCGSCVFGGHK